MYDECFPKKKVSNKQLKIQKKPWITKGIKKSLATKHKLYKKYLKNPSSNNLLLYKKYRNKLNHTIRIGKKKYYKDKFMEAHKNTKQTWNLINEVINTRKTKTTLPKTFHQEGVEISAPVEIAEHCNDYFVNVGPNLAKIIEQPGITFKSFMSRNHEESFFLLPVTEEEVEKELLKIDPSKSTGFDDLNPKVIQQIAPLIKYPLALIFNKSLSQGVVPKNLKCSLISPVYKSEDKSLVSNYRPVSVLSCFSKILEKLMFKRLMSFIDKQKILYQDQFGFRKNHSTEMAIISLTQKITEAIENKKFTIGIFLDLSKAFDTVDHSILLDKLEYYGIRGITLKWFKSYLSDRKQIVKFYEYRSSMNTISCGVPQGSVLGPLLFLLYVNDIHRSSTLLSFILFADDTNIFNSYSDINTLITTTNEELKKVAEWLRANKLSLNIKKLNSLFSRQETKKQYTLLK